MAVSPRRVSKSRKGMKNAHDGVRDVFPIYLCPKCARLLKMHVVCKCGHYRNKKIF